MSLKVGGFIFLYFLPSIMRHIPTRHFADARAKTKSGGKPPFLLTSRGSPGALNSGEIESFQPRTTSQMKSAQGQAGCACPALPGPTIGCSSAAAFAHLRTRRRRQLNVFFSCGPGFRYGDAHRSHAVPDGTAKPACPILLDTIDRRGGKCVCVAATRRRKSHQHLIEHNVVKICRPVPAPQFSHLLRQPAITIDQFGNSLPA